MQSINLSNASTGCAVPVLKTASLIALPRKSLPRGLARNAGCLADGIEPWQEAPSKLAWGGLPGYRFAAMNRDVQ